MSKLPVKRMWLHLPQETSPPKGSLGRLQHHLALRCSGATVPILKMSTAFLQTEKPSGIMCLATESTPVATEASSIKKAQGKAPLNNLFRYSQSSAIITLEGVEEVPSFHLDQEEASRMEAASPCPQGSVTACLGGKGHFSSQRINCQVRKQNLFS